MLKNIIEGLCRNLERRILPAEYVAGIVRNARHPVIEVNLRDLPNSHRLRPSDAQLSTLKVTTNLWAT